MPKKKSLKSTLKKKRKELVPYGLIAIFTTACALFLFILYKWYVVLKTERIVLPPDYSVKQSLTKPEGIIPPHTAHKKLTRPVRLPIIMYHYIEYVQDPKDTIRMSLDTNPYLFERELKIFADNKYEMYFVKDVPRILDGKIKISSHSAILTFDDGYEDFYTNVFPLLKKYRIKASLYVIYNFLDRNVFLTKEQVTELDKSGLVEIGSHTLNHAYLKDMLPQYAKQELTDSKYKLEELLGHKVETLAYPYGAFSNDTLKEVKEASYSAAVSVIPGISQSDQNIYFLSRLRSGVIASDSLVSILDNYKEKESTMSAKK